VEHVHRLTRKALHHWLEGAAVRRFEVTHSLTIEAEPGPRLVASVVQLLGLRSWCGACLASRLLSLCGHAQLGKILPARAGGQAERELRAAAGPLGPLPPLPWGPCGARSDTIRASPFLSGEVERTRR
jgi:hypothetical protein